MVSPSEGGIKSSIECTGEFADNSKDNRKDVIGHVRSLMKNLNQHQSGELKELRQMFRKDNTDRETQGKALKEIQIQQNEQDVTLRGMKNSLLDDMKHGNASCEDFEARMQEMTDYVESIVNPPEQQPKEPAPEVPVVTPV